MRCGCGYEYSVLDSIPKWGESRKKPEEKFIQIYSEHDFDLGGYAQVGLYACPKCSTVQMSKYGG